MKKRTGILLIFFMLIGCLAGFDQTVWAETGKTSIAVSSGTINIGDTVTVTVRATTGSGGSALATMTLSYDAGILEFVSCSASTYGGGGGSVTVPTDSFSVTLKAISAGTSSLSLSASDGVNFETNEELESMEGSSTSITVNNAASGGSTGGNTGSSGTGGNAGGGSGAGGNNQVLSADNSLKTLTISPGTLSPAFTGSNVNYTATVANNVTSVAVSAVPVNEKATVESVTGNTSLSVGTNNVNIVVKAENGTTATYTIKITRQSADAAQTPKEPDAETPEEPEEAAGGEIAVNGSVYKIVSSVPEEAIPVDFTAVTVNCRGSSYQGLSFNKGTMSLLYLKEAGEEGKLYIYDETRDTIYDFAKISGPLNYVIPLLAPVDDTIPENYLQTTFQNADGRSVSAYQIRDGEALSSEFYLFYGVNQDGTEGWYRYDSVEGTYQRVLDAFEDGDSKTDSDAYLYMQEQYDKLSDKYKQEKTSARNTIAVLCVLIALLIILILNILIFGWRKLRGNTDEIDEDDFEEEDVPQPRIHRERRIKQTEEELKIPVKAAGKNADTLSGQEEEPEEEEMPEAMKREVSCRGASHKAVSYKETLRNGALNKESHEKKEIDVIDFNDL